MKKHILTLSLLMLSLTLFSCAEIKSAGRTVGHTTRDVTTEIGHASRDAVKSIGEEIKSD